MIRVATLIGGSSILLGGSMNEISEYLKVFLQIAQVVTILYAVYKFTRKPHDSLEEKHETLKKRVDEHDVKIKEVETSLKQGNDKFRKQEETNATFKSVMLSFVNFELAYCASTGYEDNQDLLDAKKELTQYLTGKHHERENRD